MTREEFYNGLIDQARPKHDFEVIIEDVPQEVYDRVIEENQDTLAGMYCPTVYILLLHPFHEEYRLYLYNECMIGRYGAYEFNIEHDGEIYTVILQNND